VLIQVNISGESQKQGVPPETLQELYTAISAIKQLKLIGLMGMAAKGVNPTPAFQKVAIQEGASMVRLGSTLFESTEAHQNNE